MILAEAFLDSPTASVVTGVALTVISTTMFAAFRIVISINVMQRDIAEIRADIKAINESENIVRYSDMREAAHTRFGGVRRGGVNS